MPRGIEVYSPQADLLRVSASAADDFSKLKTKRTYKCEKAHTPDSMRLLQAWRPARRASQG